MSDAINTATNCPACGASVRVDGDDREGTMYYVNADDGRPHECPTAPIPSTPNQSEQ